MPAIDKRNLMARRVGPELAEYLYELISRSQDMDPLKGVTFNTQSGTAQFFARTQYYSNVGGTTDDSLAIGYNFSGSSIATPLPRVVTTEPAFRMGIESRYVDGMSNHLVEWNADYISPDGSFLERPFYWSANRDTDVTYMYHMADSVDLFTPTWANKSKDGLTTYATLSSGHMTVTRQSVGFGAGVLAAYGTPQLIVAGASGGIYQQNTNPNYFMDTGVAGNNRIWGIRANGGSNYFTLSVLNDAGTVETQFLKVTRSGTSITHIAIPCGLTAYANNAAALAGGLVAGDLYRTSADPSLVAIVQ
jgi:hypothetical protein